MKRNRKRGSALREANALLRAIEGDGFKPITKKEIDKLIRRTNRGKDSNGFRRNGRFRGWSDRKILEHIVTVVETERDKIDKLIKRIAKGKK